VPNVCVVSLITEGESSVAKRYFEGLENDRQQTSNAITGYGK